MTLHNVWVFGAGFGCGVLWLGFAFMLSHHLRARQPPDTSDIGATSASSPTRSGARTRRTAENLRGKTREG